jgi:hypothetical protein
VSKKTPSGPEDPFASIPPRESFDAFPDVSAFPENAIAFLTGKAHLSEVDRPLAQPDTKPLSQPAIQPVGQPESQTDSLTTGPKARQSTTPSASRSTSLSKGHKKNLIEDHTKNLKQGPSNGLILNHSQSPTQGQTFYLSSSRLNTADRLNSNQRQVLDLLLEAKPYIIKFRDIAHRLGMREASVRTILRRLQALSFLTFHKARDGNIQGVRVSFNQLVIEEYRQGQSSDHTSIHTQGLSSGQDRSNEQGQTDGPSQSRSQGQPIIRPVSQSASQTTLQEIDRKENLSLQDNLGWDDAFLELMWPRVFEVGFRVEQVGQAVTARERLGKPLEREMVALSLDRAEWELEEKGHLVEKNGDRVRSVPAYIFTALARWGILRAHPEYVSREEREAVGAAEELRRRRQAAEVLDAARFESWQAALSPEDREAAMRGFPGGSKEAWLKKYWRTQVRDLA